MNYKILLTNLPIHNNNYYYYLDFLCQNGVFWCIDAFFRSKCRTLVRIEALTSYRTYDTITVCDMFCEYVISYLRCRLYDRCSIVRTMCFSE